MYLRLRLYLTLWSATSIFFLISFFFSYYYIIAFLSNNLLSRFYLDMI